MSGRAHSLFRFGIQTLKPFKISIPAVGEWFGPKNGTTTVAYLIGSPEIRLEGILFLIFFELLLFLFVGYLIYEARRASRSKEARLVRRLVQSTPRRSGYWRVDTNAERWSADPEKGTWEDCEVQEDSLDEMEWC